MSQTADKKRANLWLSADVEQLIADHAARWETSKGETVDRLIRQAVGQEAAGRLAEQGLDAMEEMVRRVLADYSAQLPPTLSGLLDGIAIEMTTVRLLLFALIAHDRGSGVAIANEDEALRVAADARRNGTTPRLLRKAGQQP